MTLTRDRLNTIGWSAMLLIGAVLLLALTLRVNAVKAEVHLADNQITSLRRDTKALETEFETRANQQQLGTINRIEFGYEAPTSSQYLVNERQLAVYGKPAAPDAPAPIRFASSFRDDAAPGADTTGEGGLPAMVSPLTGRLMSSAAMIGTAHAAEPPHHAAKPRSGVGAVSSPSAIAASLGARLSRLDPAASKATAAPPRSTVRE